jgi:hypothetical protein
MGQRDTLELPGGRLTVLVDDEERGGKKLCQPEPVDTLSGGGIGELLQPLDIRALRKAAVFLNLVHVVPALLNVSAAITPRSKNSISVATQCNNFFCAARQRQPILNVGK